jgi:hypothetical protein
MAIQLGAVKPTMSAQNPAEVAQQKTDLQLQQAGQQMLQSGLTPQKTQIQQAAGQVAQVKGQEQLKATQQNVQQAQQGRQVQSNANKVIKVQEIMKSKQKVQADTLKNSELLDGIGMNLRNEYVNKVKEFKKDELGRTLLNARQLSDWAVLKARNEEEYAEYEQMMQQALEKKQAITEQAFKVVSQELNQQWVAAEQAKDQAAMEQIAGIRAEIKKAQDKARKDAASNSALWTIGGTVLGAVAGAAIVIGTAGAGAPVAAAAVAGGASLGASIGGAGGSAVAANQ